MSIKPGTTYRDTWTNETVTVDRVEDLGGLPFVYYTDAFGQDCGRPLGSFLSTHEVV